ncbi:MAG: hypothetical protein KDM63_05505, partial [Verrucomicrobiae bacterium]|nr:hypothetical protein [Verrucomicrobiae bacterium]
SQGCLALNEKDLVKLDHKLKRPAYVFAYAPTLLAQEVYPPAGSTPPVPAPPMPVLAKANAPASATEEHPMVAATSPASRDLPAIPRPAAIQTGPVALARDTAGTGFYSVSDVAWRP